MKKVLYSVGLLALVAGATFSFQSCNKIKEEITKNIPPITFDGDDVIVLVPAANEGDSISTAEFNIPIDIDAAIKANNTSGYDVSFNSLSSVKIKKITLQAEDGFDDTNNWTNFEGIFFAANTDLGQAKNLSYQGIWAGVDDQTANRYIPIELVFPEPQVNIKEYFDANGKATAHYYMEAKVRKTMTHPLKVRATVEYEAEF